MPFREFKEYEKCYLLMIDLLENCPYTKLYYADKFPHDIFSNKIDSFLKYMIECNMTYLLTSRDDFLVAILDELDVENHKENFRLRESMKNRINLNDYR